MTPEQCRELASAYEHLALKCDDEAKASVGLVAASLTKMAGLHRHFSDYWREKAGE